MRGPVNLDGLQSTREGGRNVPMVRVLGFGLVEDRMHTPDNPLVMQSKHARMELEPPTGTASASADAAGATTMGTGFR